MRQEAWLPRLGCPLALLSSLLFLPPTSLIFFPSFFLAPSKNSPLIIPKASVLERGEAEAIPSLSLPREPASSASHGPAPSPSPGSPRLPDFHSHRPRSRGPRSFCCYRTDAEIPVASEICSALTGGLETDTVISKQMRGSFTEYFIMVLGCFIQFRPAHALQVTCAHREQAKNNNN